MPALRVRETQAWVALSLSPFWSCSMLIACALVPPAVGATCLTRVTRASQIATNDPWGPPLQDALAILAASTTLASFQKRCLIEAYVFGVLLLRSKTTTEP